MNAPADATATLRTGRLAVHVSGGPHLSHNLTLLPQDDPLLKTEAARACPVAVAVPGRRLAGDDFAVATLYGGHDMLIVTCLADNVELRLSWAAAPLDALRLLVQARTTNGAVLDAELHLPFLDHLYPGDAAEPICHDPGRGPLASDGRPLVRAGRYPLPRACWSAYGGVAVLARVEAAVGEADPWRWLTPPDAMQVRLRPAWVDACELIIMACDPGWPGVFAALRGQLRAGLDLEEYRRPDLAWYRRQWLQHFTFLYGGEIFDHTRGRFDANRLLDEGLRFGGYDGLLLWPAYPRIGVDERSQWDFYDDLPGGRAGLRELATQARARGGRVFIPYLPWDAPGECRHGEPPVAAQELARVVADIGADGVFLDTIGSTLPQFRREIDRVRSGVVFCAELQPGPRAIEHITGSWDQAEHRQPGEVNLLRFLFPEHPSFVINRHAIGLHRRSMIARALFNGTGLVVWQDVFGEVLPYSTGETELVRCTIATLRRYADRFRGADALPLVPTAQPDLQANAFIAEDGRAALTVHNGGDGDVEGPLVTWTHDAGQEWIRAGEREADSRPQEVPTGALMPGEVAVFVSVPRR